MAICFTGLNRCIHWFSYFFGGGDNPDTGLEYWQSVAVVYRCNYDTVNGDCASQTKYKTATCRHGKQSIRKEV